LPANGSREEYLRATHRAEGPEGAMVDPIALQDSAMLAVLANATCLVRRPIGTPAAAAGEPVEILPFAAFERY
jgi:molybdopterin molybdotransferase